jgi:methionyl-tRNA formyltransferase
MGTPDFAVPCLEAVLQHYEVIGVFTQPDRPQGRGKKIQMSAVKQVALENNLEIFQPEKIRTKESREIIEALKPDVIVVVAYGQLISQKILDIPKYGCINVHASLLPYYRGAAPMNWALVNGEKKTGVTTMYMVKALDAGPMLHRLEVDIDDNMTTGELHDILSVKGSQLIIKTLKALEKGQLESVNQNEEEATHAPLMDKKMAEIDWLDKAENIHNLIRGFNPWPVAYTYYEGDKMKIFKSERTELKAKGLPGRVASVSKEGIFVNALDKQIKLIEVQLPNKKRMHVRDFILGHSLTKGDGLGE